MIAARDTLSHLIIEDAKSSMSGEFEQECRVSYDTDLKDSPLLPFPIRRTMYEEGNDRPNSQIHGRPRLG